MELDRAYISVAIQVLHERAIVNYCNVNFYKIVWTTYHIHKVAKMV